MDNVVNYDLSPALLARAYDGKVSYSVSFRFGNRPAPPERPEISTFPDLLNAIGICVFTEKVWNNRNSSINGVLSSAKGYLTQWKSTQSQLFVTLPQAGNVEDGALSWVKPRETSVKINVDAALFTDQVAYGSGLIARDCNGDLIQARTKLKVGNVFAEIAEAISIKETLSWSEEMQWPVTVIESDCLVAVQAIRSKMPLRSPFGQIIEDCRKQLLSLNNVSLLFVRRSANMAAHCIAKKSYSLTDRVFDGENIPSDVKNVLLKDLI